jgi:ATP synthase protein I
MAVFGLGSRPLRAALLWQLAATGVISLVAGAAAGSHAASSALLGGGVVIVANGAYAMVVGLQAPGSAASTVRVMLRAEAVKVALVVFGLWAVFSVYREVVPLGLIGSFVVAVLMWPVALLYKD